MEINNIEADYIIKRDLIPDELRYKLVVVDRLFSNQFKVLAAFRFRDDATDFAKSVSSLYDNNRISSLELRFFEKLEDAEYKVIPL